MPLERPIEPTAPGPARSVTELSVTGMTCGNCVRHVTEAIRSVPGVDSALVSLEEQHASVRWSPGAEQNVNAVAQAIAAAGYGAEVLAAPRPGGSHAGHKHAGWSLNLWIGVLCTVPLMIGEWVFRLGLAPWFQWISFALAGVVQVVAGAQFYRGAWNQLKVGSSNMDTLVALGSTTAFGYSLWALAAGHGGHVYFMEAAAIITLISAGHWVESRVSARASSALHDLLQLAPQTARRLNQKHSRPQASSFPLADPDTPDFRVGLNPRQRVPAHNLNAPRTLETPRSLIHSEFMAGRTPADAEETEVPVAALTPGDLVVLRPGDRVPTDGEIIEGESAVDESMLTGESVPADKTMGSRVYGGTANLDGRLVMRVTSTGEQTALAHIIAAVQRAQTSRANIQRLGDQVSSVFVPIVVAIAVFAGLWWGLAPASAQLVADWLGRYLWPAHPPMGTLAAPFLTAAAVLIVACPCAMGLATPAAIMAGANAAARRGILIRDGVALEKAGNITGVIFDKTGTLTVGKPGVAGIWESDSAKVAPAPTAAATSDGNRNTGETATLRLAAALARRSAHPVSQAIAKIGRGEREIREWQELRGAGVQAVCRTESGEWKTVRLGSLRWLRESGVDLAAGDSFITTRSAQGATLVGLALERSLAALFALEDTLKPAAAGVIRELHRQGLKTYLVTGDNALTAASIARQTGIRPENIHAEVRPEQKAEFVKQLQQQGERVAFVGDGINDAPALEQADLGIAVSRASDIAREAADIILLNSEIEAVPESLGLARATLKTIKQNLFWAFFYNAIGVPLAALGLMSPILCAAAMGFSDLIVIGNALRLRHWKMPGARRIHR